MLGPDSSPAPIILAVVVAQAASDSGRAVALAGAMAGSGLVCILACALKLGFITELRRFGLYQRLRESGFFSTIGTAVGAYREANGLEPP